MVSVSSLLQRRILSLSLPLPTSPLICSENMRPSVARESSRDLVAAVAATRRAVTSCCCTANTKERPHLRGGEETTKIHYGFARHPVPRYFRRTRSLRKALMGERCGREPRVGAHACACVCVRVCAHARATRVHTGAPYNFRNMHFVSSPDSRRTKCLDSCHALLGCNGILYPLSFTNPAQKKIATTLRQYCFAMCHCCSGIANVAAILRVLLRH